MKLEYQVDFAEFSSAALSAQKSSTFRRRQVRIVFVWYGLIVAVIVTLIIVTDFFSSPQPAAPQQVNRNLRDVLLPIAPWGILAVAVIFLVRFLRRGAYRRAFDSQPVVHRPTVLETIEGGLAFTTSVSHNEWKWAGFTKSQETSLAFVIFVSDMGMYIVPKRAFQSESEIAEFRELLRANVSPMSTGFPVQVKSPP